jgi:hypothetical protein
LGRRDHPTTSGAADSTSARMARRIGSASPRQAAITRAREASGGEAEGKGPAFVVVTCWPAKALASRDGVIPKLNVTGSSPVTRSKRKPNAERIISVPAGVRRRGPDPLARE